MSKLRSPAIFFLATLALATSAHAGVSDALMQSRTTNAWSVPKWGFSALVPPAKPSVSSLQSVDPASIKMLRSMETVLATRPVARKSPKLASLKMGPANEARLVVMDDESLAFGQARAVPQARVHWVSMTSGLSTSVRADGSARSPYAGTVSTRFVVEAPGYLPAVGYATAGTTVPVLMIRESRLGPIMKTLGVIPDAERSLVLGKVLRADLTFAHGVRVEASAPTPNQFFYSMGPMGLYHPLATETGALGDFLATSLSRGLNYLMPSEDGKEWPAWILDTRGLPPVFSFTLSESTPVGTQTQVVDAFALERPEGGIHATIGGQRGLFVPDDDGTLRMDALFPRGSSDILEVRASGYLKSWLNTIANPLYSPSAVSLFTRQQANELMAPAGRKVDVSRGIALGNFAAERYTSPVIVKVVGPDGRLNREASVYYFNADNQLDPKMEVTESMLQNFAVANLNSGEWHFVAVDARTGHGRGIQTVRVEEGSVSLVQF